MKARPLAVVSLRVSITQPLRLLCLRRRLGSFSFLFFLRGEVIPFIPLLPWESSPGEKMPLPALNLQWLTPVGSMTSEMNVRLKETQMTSVLCSHYSECDRINALLYIKTERFA